MTTDGRQARWDQHKSERRRQILDAAVAVVEREPPGAEIHVRQIAAEAGIGRPVVYRHFADRADLDRAVQAHVLDMLRARLVPQVTLTGTIDEIIVRIVSAYVDWSVEHPALHRLAEQESAGGDLPTELEVAIKEIVDQVAGLITLGASMLGVELSEEDSAALDPLVFGLVGMVFGSVRRWLWRPDREPSPEAFSRMLASTIWHAIDGHARERGVVLDRHTPVDELIAASLGDETP